MKTVAAGIMLASLLAAGAAHADRAQLAAHLGLSAEQASAMSLSDIIALKFNRDSDHDDKQSVTEATSAAAKAFLPPWQKGDEH
jgi:hypothetical protein